MLEPIVAQLKKSAKTNSDVFCTQFSTPCDGLSLSVDPVGPITFPVTARTAKSLIVESEPAKYGQKDKTLLDRSVRDTWEIPKNRIHTDQTWVAQLQKALQRIQKGLKLPSPGGSFRVKRRVEAQQERPEWLRPSSEPSEPPCTASAWL